MITLAPIDYGIIMAAFVVLMVRLLVDFREVAAARATLNAMKTIAEESYSPQLTVIVPLQSLESAKQTIARLQQGYSEMTIIVAINSMEHHSVASKLRYYIKKHSFKNIRVVTSKNLSLITIAKQKIADGLVVMLPDTADLHKNFYYDAILPFGDTSIDAVRLQSRVRPGKSVIGGFQTLFIAWGNYFDFFRPSIDTNTLLPGVMMRVKHLQKTPEKKLKVIRTQKAVLSIAPHQSWQVTWKYLMASCSMSHFITTLLLAGIAITFLKTEKNIPLVASVFTILFGALVWWALGATRNGFFDRISLAMLAPFFFIGLFFVAISRGIQIIAHTWVKGYRLLRGLGRTRNRTLQYIGE